MDSLHLAFPSASGFNLATLGKEILRIVPPTARLRITVKTVTAKVQAGRY
jgi:hypothetical protein